MSVQRGMSFSPYLDYLPMSTTTFTSMDLVVEMWLSHLLAQTCAVLANAEGMTTENLLGLAGNFIDSHCAFRSNPDAAAVAPSPSGTRRSKQY